MTPWPNLSDADRANHFPLHLKYNDYVHQSCSIRDCRSRTVTLEMMQNGFDLKDEREFTKFRQLSGKRFDIYSKRFTIVIDRLVLRFGYGEIGDFPV